MIWVVTRASLDCSPSLHTLSSLSSTYPKVPNKCFSGSSTLILLYTEICLSNSLRAEPLAYAQWCVCVCVCVWCVSLQQNSFTWCRICVPQIAFIFTERKKWEENSMWFYYKPFLNIENSPLMMHFQGGADLDPFWVKTINTKFLTPGLKAIMDQLTVWKSADSSIKLAQTLSRLEDFHAVTF
jgi:hypothetical protein